MKKIFTVLFTLFFCCLVFTSFSPSLDGRAVVADVGVMPQGVFARTVGYLPGDSISVTNLAKKSTVDILVIGALDPSEGVAILLSPEAATLLGMEKDGNNIVKITKRSGQLDETVSGTAVIDDSVEELKNEDSVKLDTETNPVEKESEENQDANSNIETTNPDNEDKSSEEETRVEESSMPLEEETVPVAEPEKANTDNENVNSNSDIIADTPVEENIKTSDNEKPFEEIQATAEPDVVEDEPEKEPVSNEEESIAEKVDEVVPSETIQEESVVDEVLQENVSPEDKVEKTDDGSSIVEPEDSSAVDSFEDTNKIENQEEKCDDTENDVTEDESVSTEPYSEIIPEVDNNIEKSEKADIDVLPEEQKNITEPTEVVSEEPPVVAEPQEEPIEADQLSNPVISPVEKSVEKITEIPSDVESKSVEEEPIEADSLGEATVESYEPIILVPSEPNPPEKEDMAKEEAEESTEKSGEKNIESKSIEEPVVEAVESINIEETKNISTSTDSKKSDYDYDKYTVPSLKNLKSGKYYIQIAVYGDKSNIKNIFDKYNKKYPIVLVPLVSGKATQVLIGPLSIDEYGTVLNRFKSYGFKDAFLRKVK